MTTSQTTSQPTFSQSASAVASVERRRQPRVPVQWAVKLSDAIEPLHYVAGRTRNISGDGALIRLNPTGRNRRLHPGQHVRVGFAGPTGPGVLTAAGMLEATVVRRFEYDGTEEVAVQFREAGVGIQGPGTRDHATRGAA